jgi:hypothetical protein
MIYMPKKLFLFICSFLFFIPVQVSLGPLPLKITVLLILVLSILGAIGILSSKIQAEIFYLIALMLTVAMYLIVNTTPDGLRDLYFAKNPILAIMILLAAYQLVKYYQSLYKNQFVNNLLNTIIAIGVLHAIIMIMALVSPEFRDFLYRFVVISEKAQLVYEINIRSTGLFSSGFSNLSLFNGVLFITSLVHMKSDSYRNSFLKIFVLSIFFIAVTISGRMGFLIIITGVLYFFIYRAFFTSEHYVSVKASHAFLFMIVVSPVLFMIDLERFQTTIYWAFEFIYTYLETGVVSTGSTSVLFGEMYFLPQNEIDRLIGTANFGRSENLPPIRSDSGIILFIHGGGIIGLLALFSIYFYLLFIAYTKVSQPKLRFILTFIVFALLIGNIKDVYFFSIDGNTQLLLTVFIMGLLTDNQLNNRVVTDKV